MISRTIPHYRILERLGGGEFGAVYKRLRGTTIRILCKIVGATLFASIPSPGLAQAQGQIDAVPLLRVYNQQAGWHLYTTDQNEVDRIIPNGWRLEGTAGWIFRRSVAGTTPLYRRYRQSDGDHLYTISRDEADRAIFTHGYVDEGIVGFVAAQELPGTRPFRRFNNSKFGHLYTADVNDAATAVQRAGYVEEGLAGFIWTAPTSLPTDNPKGNEGTKDTVTGDGGSKREGTKDDKTGGGGQNTGADSQTNWTVIAGAIATLLTAIATLIAAMRRRDKNQG
jgi:LPXTG-motif cell wall-anchored protein